ncbi:MAG TPA: hypothetical protein VF928_07870 [Usitatibacteraceae bacterium]
MKVSVFAEHSSVLAHWWERRSTQPVTLIYLDAHLDLQFVSRARIERLKGCRTPQQLAALAKPHHLWPDDEFVYSIEDFLYPAAQLGLVKQLIWVTPPHVDTNNLQHAFARLQQMEGIELEELESFERQPGGWIAGRLLGLELIICAVETLNDLPLPNTCLVDIDVDYFIAIPGDAVWVDPKEIFAALNALPVKLLDVTISRSVSSGFTPLRYRFLGDYLAALWQGDDASVSHFDKLLELDRQLLMGDGSGIEGACRQELIAYPRCAATWHLLGLAQAGGPEALHSQEEAQAICADYRPDWMRSACQIRGRRLATDMAYVLGLEKRISALDVSVAEQAIAWAAAGLLYAVFHDLERAVECNRHYQLHFGRSHGELGIEIAKLALAGGDAKMAIPYLEAALDDDESRVTAHVYLAQALASLGKIQEAKKHLQAAHKLSPAWVELSGMLASAEKATGDTCQAEALLARHHDMRQRTQQLFRRLNIEKPLI